MVPNRFSVHLTSKHASPEFEAIWCKVFAGKFAFKVGVVYRPPSNFPSMLDLLFDYISQNSDPSVPTIIVGDFNYGKINWCNLTAADKICHDFMLFMNSLGFSQKTLFTTRNDSIRSGFCQ